MYYVSFYLCLYALVLCYRRFAEQVSPGIYEAPYDKMAVCFMQTVGLAALNAWNPTVTQASVSLYLQVACGLLERHNGYLVNTSGGLLCTAFTEPALAVRWALSTIQTCLEADWDSALLNHELGGKKILSMHDAQS